MEKKHEVEEPMFSAEERLILLDKLFRETKWKLSAESLEKITNSTSSVRQHRSKRLGEVFVRV